MELLLNLAWLCIVFALFILLRLQGDSGSGRLSNFQASKSQRYLILIALSFLLLPVISMTDDLYAMTTMAESERADRRISAVQSQHLQDQTQIHPAFSAGHVYLECPWICFGVVNTFRPLPNVEMRPIALCSDRAPPKN